MHKLQKLRPMYYHLVVAVEGLRARRRRETARDIHVAALRLAREHGFDAATVEAISAAAGIAPRTFFNYFPTKEDAVVHGPFDLDEADVATFVAGTAVSYPELLAELVDLLAATLARDAPNGGELHDVMAVAQDHPGVLAAMLAQMEGFRHRVTTVVAARLGRPEDDETAGLIASLALTILRAGVDRWTTRTASSAEDGPVADIAHVSALMKTMFQPEG